MQILLHLRLHIIDTILEGHAIGIDLPSVLRLLYKIFQCSQGQTAHLAQSYFERSLAFIPKQNFLEIFRE